MFYAELQNRRKLILKETKEFRYVLYEASKIETDKLFKAFNKELNEEDINHFKDVIDLIDFCGEVDDVTYHHVKNIIPIKKNHVIKSVEWHGSPEIIFECKCYQQGKENIHNNIIIHEDKLSSFKCACEKVKSKSFIVLKEPIKNATTNDNTKENYRTETEEVPKENEDENEESNSQNLVSGEKREDNNIKGLENNLL